MKVGSWQHWWQRQWLKQPFIAVYKWWLCSLWTYHNMNTLKLSHVQCFVCVCMWVHGHTTILLRTHFWATKYFCINAAGVQCHEHVRYSCYILCMWEKRAGHAWMPTFMQLCKSNGFQSARPAVGFRQSLAISVFGMYMKTKGPKLFSMATCSLWQHVHVRYSCYILCITTTHVVVW